MFQHISHDLVLFRRFIVDCLDILAAVTAKPLSNGIDIIIRFQVVFNELIVRLKFIGNFIIEFIMPTSFIERK